MPKHRLSYLMLVGFAVLMIVILMLDDPAKKQAEISDFRATQQAAGPVVLFENISAPTQIHGINVLDNSDGTGILVMRNDEGLWYVPHIPDIQEHIPANDVVQSLVDNAAVAIMLMVATQSYDATPENFEAFGLIPEPNYLFQFTLDASGSNGYVMEIGDTNPDNVAYYVWSRQDEHIYLIPKAFVDPVLTMLDDPLQNTPRPNQPSADGEATAPVP